MSDDKTRVLTAAEAAGLTVEKPRFVNGKIVFYCPNGHRLVVAQEHAGKRGRCDKAGCGVAVVIPAPPAREEAAKEPAAALPGSPTVGESPADGGDERVAAEEAADAGVPPGSAEAVNEAAVAEPSEPSPGGEQQPDPQAEDAEAEAADWQFTGVGDAGGADAAAVSEEAAPAAVAWGGFDGGQPEGDAFDNPTARLVARLWVERDHGGVVELHLTGGSVILPEWYESRWSRGTHGLFASQAPDGSITLTAVAWEAVQKVVVRQVQGLPDGMFE